MCFFVAIPANTLFQITWTAKSLFSTYNELPFGTVRFVSYLPLSHIAGQVCMQVLDIENTYMYICTTAWIHHVDTFDFSLHAYVTIY